MTYGNEPRRKRSSSSSRKDEAEEADSWLAGLRPASGQGAEPDPFDSPNFEVPTAYDALKSEPPARGRWANDEGPEPPTRGRWAGDEEPEPPTRGRRIRDEAPEPTRAFGGFDTEPRESPSRGLGRRRAREDAEQPAYPEPPLEAPYSPAPPRTGRRRSRDDAPSYDHGPELTPIIKPLSAYPTQPPTEPPPLTPIFPSLGNRSVPPPPAPTGPPLPAPTGPPPSLGGIDPDDLPRRGRRSHDVGHDDTAPRRPRPRPDDTTAMPRAGRTGAVHDPAAYARGPVGPVLDQPPPRSFEQPPPRSFDQPPPRSFDQPPPPRSFDEPPPRSFDERDSGEFSIGGTRRALQPPDTRPAGPPPGPPPGRSGPRGPRGGAPASGPARVNPHRPHRWIAALSVIGVIVLVAACGLGTYFMVKDERKGPTGARTSGSQSPQERDISSRTVDSAPLTEAEVFPTDSVPSGPNEPPYVVLKTQIGEDCTVAAADELGKLLVDAGCNQVVRATMKSPTGDYLITAGLFNLRDQDAASTAFNGVKPIIDATKGRFLGMSVGPNTGTDAIVRAPTQLGWNFRGHFIAYCVIARTDGQPFAANDQVPNQITFDIVETYLEGTVLGARATGKPSTSPN